MLWHDRVHASPTGAIPSNGASYLSSSGDSSAVYALHARDGSLLWSYPVAGQPFNAPILVGSSIYLGASNGIVYALQAQNGKLLWHHLTDLGA